MAPAPPATGAIPDRGRGLLLPTALVAAVALAWAGWSAYGESRQRAFPLDLDGWGHLIPRLQQTGRDALACRAPSLWKGPIIPFVFGLCYLLAPFAESVLVLNAVALALAAGCLFVTFCRLGSGRTPAALAVLSWVFYLPHQMVFGYYYAEPVLSLISALLFAAAAVTARGKSPAGAALCGALAGVLVLARAPFLLVVLGLGWFLWAHLGERRRRGLILFAAGLLLTYSPWPVRNYLAEGRLIPFTLEGGKILFQGTFLPGDDLVMNQVRQAPGFAELERDEEGKTDLEQYDYWRELAVAQALRDPLGQLRLCVRKALRFWMYLPKDSWLPQWKTGLVALLCVPLAVVGWLRNRRDLLAQLCALWVGGLWLFHTLVHAELRYNFPVLPMMFLLALLGWAPLLRRAAGWCRRQAGSRAVENQVAGAH